MNDNIKIQPREYQKSIYESAKKSNTLVILPTGTGKTLIAVMLASYFFNKHPLKKILIVAPTRPLIEQHISSFQKTLPEGFADMQLFTGKTNAEKRKKIWQTAEFVFSTPQCIANDIQKKLYDLSDVSLLIVDEAHRCLKNYAYNKVAHNYKEKVSDGRILGLTASPGGDKKKILEICKNLDIDNVEVRTRDSPDVKKYLKELTFEKIEVTYPTELIEIKGLLEEIYNEKISELKNRGVSTYIHNKVMLLNLQSKLMSELRQFKDGNKMQAVSLTAQALKIVHAIELIETQTVNSFLEYIRGLYKQASEKKSAGVQKLTKDPRFTKAFTLATSLNIEHPKIAALKDQVQKKINENKDAKIIIFAQYRETVKKIKEVTNKIDGITSEIFVGQSQKKDSQGKITGLKQKEQKEMIEKFKSGKINVLIATSIGEEGLDIPEVSMVLFYEPVPSAIRKIQRAGRTARLSPGELKILITKNTKDEVYHYASHHKEKRMHKAIDEIKKEFKNNNNSNSNQKKLF